MISDQEALASRRVARRVNQLDGDLAHLDHITRVMSGQCVGAETGGLGHEFDLRALQMNRHVDLFEKIGDAVDPVAHHGSADVIGVVVRAEHTDEAHPVGGQHVEQAGNVIGRIDNNGLFRLAVADQIAEIHHLLSHHVGRGKVSPTEELTEIEASIHDRDSRLHPMSTSTPRIAYLGPTGTFTEQALLSQPDLATAELVPLPRFFDVLAATAEGETDLGFVAIENAIEGTVNITLDALAFDHDLLIQREVVLDIHLNLMARPGNSLSDITTVSSHPVANAQCRKFLHKELPEAEVKAANSTAEAAQLAMEQPNTAAVGPEQAAKQYGLELLARDIADHAGNQTRFVLVGPAGVPPPSGHDKTTVVLSQREDKPGSLVAILQEFSARNINLSKLSSRPTKTELGQYRFIIDLNGHIADDVTAEALRNIRAKYANVKFLGSYPAAGTGANDRRQEASLAWAEADQWMQGLRAQID